MVHTVECRRRKTCGWCTDFESLSETNPNRCPTCGGTIVLAGTNTPYYDREGKPPHNDTYDAD
jgi:DNA-directed RNA polymerase subunit RPC12/RpoP